MFRAMQFTNLNIANFIATCALPLSPAFFPLSSPPSHSPTSPCPPRLLAVAQEILGLSQYKMKGQDD